MRGSLPNTSPSIFTARVVLRGNVHAHSGGSEHYVPECYVPGWYVPCSGTRNPSAQSRMQLLSVEKLAWTHIFASFFQVLLFLFDNFLAQSPQN
jgi:hypothetical protein